MINLFLSTHSVRSATKLPQLLELLLRFLSTHSVRSATATIESLLFALKISIHALRKECDSNRPGIGARWLEISIHALRKECDNVIGFLGGRYFDFYPRTP